MLKIDVVQVGVLATNCYVVSSQGSSDCVVIDPGSEPARIIEFLDDQRLNPSVIISTHAHADHTGAVAPLVERYGSKFMIGAGDVVAAREQLDWLKSMLGDYLEPPTPSRSLEHRDSITIEDVEIEVLSTPGHTRGSSSYYVDGHVFTGDTLFKESIGRFDLSDGDEHQEIASIKNVLFALDDDTIVLPGHGPSTTVGHERVANRYVR
ncbi:MBL fold metallo-hydrolase [Dehalococcoides mccartyi]|nr:MBL fold metallo-hydrolase [Dehalococcoides mccartyi]